MTSSVAAITTRGPAAGLVSRIGGRNLTLILAMVGIATFFTIVTPYFLSWQTVLNVGRGASTLLVVSIGATLVIMAGEIDLTPGAIVALISVSVPAMIDLGLPVPVFVVVALLIGAAVGGVSAFVSLRLLVPSFLATMGILAIVRGLAVTISTQPRRIRGELFADLFSGSISGISLSLLYAAVIVAIAALYIRNSRFGMRTRAVGSNAVSARLLGIPTIRTKTIVFILAGILSAAGGILLLGRTMTGESGTAVGLELNAIAAVLLGGGRLGGGRGSIVGTALGALLLTMTLYGIAGMSVPTAWQYIVQGAILVVVVLTMRKT